MSIRLYTQGIICRLLQLTDKLMIAANGFSHIILG